MISKETATAIALAHREIETAEALLKKISDALDRREQPDLRDSFGRQRGLQLGVPTSETGMNLYDVPWSIARPVIETHIAAQRALVTTLSAKAVAEMSLKSTTGE